MRGGVFGARSWGAGRARGPCLALVLAMSGNGTVGGAPDLDPDATEGATSMDESAPTTLWTPEDREIFASTLRRAVSDGLDTLPPGRTTAGLALSFVGARYTPGTLEAEEAERLVINLREFDCVTFVESVLALARVLRGGSAEALADLPRAERRFEGYLTNLRYRGGVLDGYPSRLHYFSEWLTDAEGKGWIRVVTGDLDPAVDEEPISFMSTHPSAYRQLADPGIVLAIRDVERALGGKRLYVPEDRLEAAAARMQSGDVIAATSTAAGLDVAHTGFAVRVEGRLHLVHAPLGGGAVEVSRHPLAGRIRASATQDGVMVGRPSF